MVSCDRSRYLSAYHDGELDGETRESLRLHLAGCASCAAEFARMQKLSQLLMQAAPEPMSNAALARLHRHVAGTQEVAVMHLAEFLTMAAAMVLLFCGGMLWRASGSQPSPLPTVWEAAAVMPGADASASTEVQLASWIVKDLSPEHSDD